VLDISVLKASAVSKQLLRITIMHGKREVNFIPVRLQ
jgi:hypothetical protein